MRQAAKEQLEACFAQDEQRYVVVAPQMQHSRDVPVDMLPAGVAEKGRAKGDEEEWKTGRTGERI
jgi:hypothetical protein